MYPALFSIKKYYLELQDLGRSQTRNSVVDAGKYQVTLMRYNALMPNAARIAIRTSFCKVTKGVHNSYCSPSALNLELVDLYERQLGMPFLPQNPCSLCCHLTNFKGYYPFSYLSKCKSNLRNESFVISISPILFLFCPILTAKV